MHTPEYVSLQNPPKQGKCAFLVFSPHTAPGTRPGPFAISTIPLSEGSDQTGRVAHSPVTVD